MPIEVEYLAQLIADHAGPLRIWVRSRCPSGDDVVQDAFCRLAIEDPPPSAPVAWLYTVCRNLAEKQRLSEIRRRQRERDCASRESSPGAPHESTQMAETLAAVEALEEGLREVLVARVWGRLTLEEVGKLCGISVATAHRRYEAAIQSLRAALATLPEEQT